MSKLVTEAYERDGLRVSPLAADERHEWAETFPGHRRRVGGDRPDDGRTYTRRDTHCGETVHQGRSSHRCAREAVAMIEARDGRREPVCAQHLSGAQRRATNDKRKGEERQEQGAAEKAARARVEDAARRLGVPVESVDLDWRMNGGYSTEVATIRIDELVALADFWPTRQINT